MTVTGGHGLPNRPRQALPGYQTDNDAAEDEHPNCRNVLDSNDLCCRQPGLLKDASVFLKLCISLSVEVV